ncbi:MAG: hypothetical protein KGJ11_06005, partial [Candidatus Omnitrophica bacterium]|nr:hypothetical protein [Candidatus Omnitrophota bacterium]
IFFSSPVYLLGILPLMAHMMGKQKDLKGIPTCTAGFIGIFILGKIMAHLQSNTDFWNPVWFRPDPLKLYLATFTKRVFSVLVQDADNSRAGILVANAWGVMIITGLLTIRRRSIPFAIGTLLILACTYFVNCDDQWRYLLPLSLFLILWFGVQSFEWIKTNAEMKILISLMIGAFIITGILISWNYKETYRQGSASSGSMTEMQRINTMIAHLKASGVKYVYSLDDDLSWKLIYFSNEKILSRWMSLKSRRPQYVKAVDRAFLTGQKVALVGNMLDEILAYLIVESEGRPVLPADPYFVCLDPSQQLIFYKLRFQIKPNA